MGRPKNQKRSQTELETNMKKIEADFEQQKAGLADLSKPASAGKWSK